MNPKGSLFKWTSNFYENAFSPARPECRKATSTVLFVTMGYTAALSCLVIGVKVGYALPFGQAVLSCIVGNLILMIIGTFMGIIGCETGWSTSFLVRKLFGKSASLLMSWLIILLSIYWVGMNGDSFARVIVTLFPRWPIPVSATAVILVGLWGITAAYGWRGLAMTSFILTPMAVVLAVSSLGMLFVEYFVFPLNQKHPANSTNQWIWIPAWILGSTVGIWSYYTKFLISPVNALVVSGCVYAILTIIVNRKNHFKNCD